MGIFGSIKDAIFGDLGKDKDKPAAQRPVTPTTGTRPGVAPTGNAGAGTMTATRPQAMDEVDVERRLDGKPGADNLNWRTSIVDLMKLIGVDSSLSARKELAQELGYTGALDGSAEMNTWLHRRTMQELAKNGGRVPKEYLD